MSELELAVFYEILSSMVEKNIFLPYYTSIVIVLYKVCSMKIEINLIYINLIYINRHYYLIFLYLE